MRQERKPEAGKYKHNNAEHPIWIFDGGTYSLVCFVLQCGPKRYPRPQLLRLSFVLDRIVHLLVPSESFSRRGKKISESLAPSTGHDRADGTRRGTLQQKVKKLDRPKNCLTKEKSKETMEASPRCYALLPLSTVAYVSAV